MEADIKRKILLAVIWATIEDDVNIWEVPWEINSVYPEGIENEVNKKIALKILNQFLEDELIEFFSGPYENLTKIQKNKDIRELLNNKKIFEIPENDSIEIRISATEKGKEFYNKLYNTTDLNSLYAQDID